MSALFAIPDSSLLLTMLAVLFASAILQTTTGFGFAILSAPILTVLLGGPEAVSTILITGTVVELLILFVGRHERRDPDYREVVVLGVSAVPGLFLGAWLLVTLPRKVLLIVVAAAVILAVGYRLWARRAGASPQRPVPGLWGVAAGLASGALGTSTTLAGPPVVYYLTRRMSVPSRIRDTLIAQSLVRLPLTVIALLIARGLVIVPGIGWLVLAVLGGFVVGTALYRRMRPERYEPLVLWVLVFAAVTAVIAAFV